jgi:hypothetical protein
MRRVAALAFALALLMLPASTALGISTNRQGRTINPTAGQRFTDVVATFDSPSGDVSQFSAGIAWGDQSSSAGTITQTAASPNSQTFSYSVSGTHTYAQAGDFAITVTLNDVQAPGPESISSTAHVAAPQQPPPGGEPPAPQPEPQNSPPTPVLTLETTSPGAGAPIAIDAARSSDADGTVISYAFDLDGNGSYETHCGASPSAAASFGSAGPVTIGLLVTDSGGATSTTSATVTVTGKAPKKFSKGTAPSGLTLGYCGAPGSVGRPGPELALASCLRTVAARIAEAVSNGCFEESNEDPGFARPAAKSAALPPGGLALEQHFYSTTSRLKLNGIDLKPKSGGLVVIHKEAAKLFTRRAGADVTLDAGVVGVPAVPLRSGSLSWAFPIKGNKFRIAAFDVSKAASLFGFDIAGSAAVDLTSGSGGGPRAEVPIHIGLPGVFTDPTTGKGLTADVTLKADNKRKLYVDALRVDLPQAFLGGLQINNLFFEYRAEESIWRGGANLLLPSGNEIHASPPPDNYGVGFRNGGLDYLGGDFTFPAPGVAVFTGVFLHRIGLVVETHPTRFTGSVSLTAGSVGSKTLAAIDGTVLVAFATPSEPLTVRDKRAESLAIDVDGKLRLLGAVDLAEAHLTYIYPYYIEAAGKFSYQIIKDRVFVKATAGGWVDAGSGKFNIEAGADLCIDIKVWSGCKGGSVVLSSRGLGGCVETWFADVGGGIYWSGGGKIFFRSCDVGAFRATASRAAADGSFGVDVSKDAPFEAIEVVGRDAAPSIELTGPGGAKISTPEGGFLDTARAMIWRGIGDDKSTWLLLPRTAPGRWTIAPAAGSQIATVRTAHGLPKPKVSARLSGRASKRTLAYDVTPLPGQTVTFVERGPSTAHVIGTAKGTRGRITFRTADGPGGPRSIVAVVDNDGLVRKQLTVARFRAPKPAAPERPRRVRVRRTGSGLSLVWPRSAGADRYVVGVDVSDGRRLVFITRKPSLQVPAIPSRAGASVRVAGLTVANRPGRSATARVKPAASRRPRA